MLHCARCCSPYDWSLDFDNQTLLYTFTMLRSLCSAGHTIVLSLAVIQCAVFCLASKPLRLLTLFLRTSLHKIPHASALASSGAPTAPKRHSPSAPRPGAPNSTPTASWSARLGPTPRTTTCPIDTTTCAACSSRHKTASVHRAWKRRWFAWRPVFLNKRQTGNGSGCGPRACRSPRGSRRWGGGITRVPGRHRGVGCKHTGV